jgi:hypothetical protein
MNAPVLALDLASVTGWAVGEPGGTPAHGSIRFASAGASHEAIFAAALKWISDKITFYAPGMIVWEAPMATSFRRGNTNTNTTTLLFGLPAIVGAVAYLREVYDVRKAYTKDVRQHFIGQNAKGHIGKKLVIRQCRAMGWSVSDDNEADALATWHYMCSLIEPKLAMRRRHFLGDAALAIAARARLAALFIPGGRHGTGRRQPKRATSPRCVPSRTAATRPLGRCGLAFRNARSCKG